MKEYFAALWERWLCGMKMMWDDPASFPRLAEPEETHEDQVEIDKARDRLQPERNDVNLSKNV